MFDNIDLNVRKKQGNVGVARAVYEYTRMGYTVLVPLSDSDKYDLVIDSSRGLSRVQVKTSRGKHGLSGYSVQLSTSGGSRKINTIRKRQDGDYDILFVLLETGDCYSIPSQDIAGRHRIVVGSSMCKYKAFKL